METCAVGAQVGPPAAEDLPDKSERFAADFQREPTTMH
jgi:hypothetical protein